MSLSVNQKIAIFGIVVTLFVGTGNILAITGNAELIHSSFDPPEIISLGGRSVFSFTLANYGSSTGSYEFSLESNEILLTSKDSLNLDDYMNEISFGHLLPKSDRAVTYFYLMADNSNIKPNATVTFVYIDNSPKIFKTRYVWEWYYELDGFNIYKLVDAKFYEKEFIQI